MHKMMWTVGVGLLAMAMQAGAGASSIDFTITGGTSNNFSYAGTGGDLSGNGIAVASVSGFNTTGTLTPGFPYPITSGILTFVTGAYTGNDGGQGWSFGPGGFLTITGTGVPGVSTTPLFSGSFSQDVLVTQAGNEFQIIAAGFVGNLNPQLAAGFDFDTTNPAGGAMGLLIQGANASTGPISGTLLDSGNLALSVPEPNSAMLMGISSIAMCFALMYRRFVA